MSDDTRQGGPANPFEDLLGAPPATVPAGSPVTLLPRTAPEQAPPEPSAQSLELGFDPGAALPAPEPRKPERPELADWRDGLPQGPPNAAAPTDLAALTSRGPQSTAKKPPLGAIVGGLIVVVAVVVAAGAFKGGKSPVDSTAVNTRTEADQLADLGMRPENVPACWTRDAGHRFRYKDGTGEVITVVSIADVPLLFRVNAECIPHP